MGSPPSERVRRQFVEQCNAASIPVRRLKRYAIENYFAVRALREVFDHQMPSEIVEIDPSKPVLDQIGFSPKKHNQRIAAAMTRDEVADSDLGEFLLEIGSQL